MPCYDTVEHERGPLERVGNMVARGDDEVEVSSVEQPPLETMVLTPLARMISIWKPMTSSTVNPSIRPRGSPLSGQNDEVLGVIGKKVVHAGLVTTCRRTLVIMVVPPDLCEEPGPGCTR